MIRALIRSLLVFLLRTPSRRFLTLMGAYGTVLGLSLFVAYQLRFDFVVPDHIERHMLFVCAISVAVQLLCLFLFHQFDRLVLEADIVRLTEELRLLQMPVPAINGNQKVRPSSSSIHTNKKQRGHKKT